MLCDVDILSFVEETSVSTVLKVVILFVAYIIPDSATARYCAASSWEIAIVLLQTKIQCRKSGFKKCLP